MKRVVVGVVSALSVLAMPLVASAYTCYSRSPAATGWETSPYLAVAQRGALYQCAIRTPRGYICRITRCTY
ncbi:MAG TPA: hypothetical protein VKU90_14480 [Caulobacteraceae bacterium]|nr:hypothetical protein [Caulobacteraceae bacterium]